MDTRPLTAMRCRFLLPSWTSISLVRLDKPAVEKTVWSSGGRYVDIYFSKYMDISSLEEANSISLEDGVGSTVMLNVGYPVPAKTRVNGLKTDQDCKIYTG